MSLRPDSKLRSDSDSWVKSGDCIQVHCSNNPEQLQIPIPSAIAQSQSQHEVLRFAQLYMLCYILPVRQVDGKGISRLSSHGCLTRDHSLTPAYSGGRVCSFSSGQYACLHLQNVCLSDSDCKSPAQPSWQVYSMVIVIGCNYVNG